MVTIYGSPRMWVNPAVKWVCAKARMRRHATLGDDDHHAKPARDF